MHEGLEQVWRKHSAEGLTSISAMFVCFPFLKVKLLYDCLQCYTLYLKISMSYVHFLTPSRIYHMSCSTCLNVTGSDIKC